MVDRRRNRKRRTRNRLMDAKYYTGQVKYFSSRWTADASRLRDEYARYVKNAINEIISYLKYLS